MCHQEDKKTFYQYLVYVGSNNRSSYLGLAYIFRKQEEKKIQAVTVFRNNKIFKTEMIFCQKMSIFYSNIP